MKLHFSLLGTFCVRTETLEDITPVGAKNQALLALLALSPGMTRSRRWLEDHLWSRFAPEQASANLRQALSKIRKSAPELALILKSDRTNVSLDASFLELDITTHSATADPGRELLEGLDVKDPEFDDWIRQERSAFQNKTESLLPRNTNGITISCSIDTHQSTGDTLAGQILADQIGQSISEHVRAVRQDPNHRMTDAVDEQDLEISCTVLEKNGQTSAYLRVLHSPSGRILHSRLHDLGSFDAVVTCDAPVAALVFDVADRVISQIPLVMDNARPEVRASGLARLALYRLFTFDAAGLDEADSLLQQAYELDPNPVYLAWRSQCFSSRVIELHSTKLEENREASIALAHRALETGRDNALVQALIAQVRIVTMRDTLGGLELAQQAVAQNPSNGLAWNSYALAQVRTGNLEDAFKYSSLGRRIARLSPFRQWWEMHHCLVSLACNRLDEAILAGEAAARDAPAFRPAHRHLIALYAKQGQWEKAQATAAALQKTEPSFTLDAFVNDEKYPVRTLRETGLLTPVRALL